MKIRKAVIPAAGFGTRFLPVTKTIPKEMLPIVDKPVIQFVVEEAVASGIEEVILITSPNKKPLEDFFDRNFELEQTLEKSGKTAAALGYYRQVVKGWPNSASAGLRAVGCAGWGWRISSNRFAPRSNAGANSSWPS